MVEQENYHIFHLCIYTFPAINVHYCHYLYPVKTGFMVIGRYVESVIYDVPPHRLPITSPVNSLLVCICMRCTYWSPLCPPTTIISEGPTSRFLCTHFRWKLIFTSDSKNMHLWFSIQYNSRDIRRQTLVSCKNLLVCCLTFALRHYGARPYFGRCIILSSFNQWPRSKLFLKDFMFGI